MKRVIFFILIFILLCFLFPLIFLEKRVVETSNNNIETDEYDYKKYSTVKLLHNETGEIEEIKLDEYLYGVVSAEMPANYEEEALKAQGIVARTYTIFKILNSNKHENADICDSASCCQAWISKEKRMEKWEEENREYYWNKIVNAVDSTKGKIITYNGEIINAFFHSNSGGATEKAEDVWGGKGYEYLQTVATSGENNYKQYNSEAIFSKEEFISRLKENHQNIEIDFNNPEWFKIVELTESGRIKNIKIGNIELPGTEVRSIFELKSTNFNIALENENIKFTVIGYGHGVGMSQTGANSMAVEGKKYDEIIHHFYKDVEIIDV